MRLARRVHKEIVASTAAAVRARDEANERLAQVRDLAATQRERGRAEKATIIATLKRMREQDSLAKLLLDTIEREATNGADQS